MDIPATILVVIGVAAAAGLITAYYRRSEGQGTISLLEANNAALKEALALKDIKITALQAQLQTKDDIIERLVRDGKADDK